MTDTPETTGSWPVASPASSSDYLLGIQGGVNKKFAARKLPRVETTNPYTFALSDADGYIRFVDGDDENAQVVLTIPKYSDVPLPLGTQIVIEVKGLGGLQINGAVGVQVNPSDNNVVNALYQYAVVVAAHVDTDEWTIIGGLAG